MAKKIPYKEFSGQKEFLLIFDRFRDINYNGSEIMANTYMCSTCKASFIGARENYLFCPFCGCEFKAYCDVSA